MILNKYHISITIFFLFIIIVALFNFVLTDKSIIGGDVSFFYNNFNDSLFFWQKTTEPNYNYSNIVFNLPYGFTMMLLNNIGIPIVFSQNIFLFIIFIITAVGIYLFCKEISPEKNNIYFIVSASVLMMFNGFTLFNWSAPDPIILTASASFPWLLFVFIKGFNSKKIFKPAFIFALASIFFASGYMNMPFLVILFGIIFVYLLWHIFLFKEDLKRKILYVLTCVFLFILFNLWWIGIIPLSLKENFEASKRLNLQTWIEKRAEASSIKNLLKLEGYYKWHRFQNEKYYLGFQKIYAEYPILDYLKYIFSLSIIIFLILNKKRKIVLPKKVYFFLFLFVFYLFFEKSIHPPFAFVNQWLYDHVPLFIIFRSGAIKFGIIGALSLSILWGFLIYTLSKLWRDNKYLKKVVLLPLILLPLIIYFPFFTDNLISDGQSSQVLYKQKIPSYYFDFINYVHTNTSKDAIFMLFPSHKSTWVETSWEHYGVDFFITLLNRQYINNHFVSKYHGLIYSNISQLNDFNDLEKYLELLKVDYLVFNDDYKSIEFTEKQTKDIENYVASNFAEKIFEKGNIRLYKLNNSNSQKISTSNNLYIYEDGSTAIPDYIGSDYLTNFLLIGNNEKNYKSNFIEPIVIKTFEEKNILEKNHWSLRPENDEIVASNSKDALKTEIGNIKYKFETENDGNYELLINTKYSEEQGKLRFKIDNGPWSNYKEFVYQKRYEKQRNNVYLSTNLGVLNLIKGAHAVEFEDFLNKGERMNIKRISLIPIIDNSQNLPAVEFKKINPTKYKIKITDVKEPFFLNFLENYSPFWEIYLNDKKIDNNSHFLLNGLYNAWYVEQTGNLEGIITFKIQRIFYWLLFVSILSILLSIIYLLKLVLKHE